MNAILFDYQQLGVLIKLVLAMFLGALIGLDREASNKPAGLRTHILVAGSTALLIAVAEFAVSIQVNEMGENITRTDPIRIIDATILGIGFLGAGTIIRDRSQTHVEGLTTRHHYFLQQLSACMWHYPNGL